MNTLCPSKISSMPLTRTGSVSHSGLRLLDTGSIPIFHMKKALDFCSSDTLSTSHSFTSRSSIEMGHSTIPVDTTNHGNAIALPLFSILAIIISYLPLRSFYQNRNFAACNMVFVVAGMNVMGFINPIIWPNGNWTKWWSGQGLCDLETYIRFPITVSLAASLSCFSKNLSDAIDVNQHSFHMTLAMRRRALIISVLFCWGIPIIQMGLYYIIQT